jgi:hypothetical protein
MKVSDYGWNIASMDIKRLMFSFSDLFLSRISAKRVSGRMSFETTVSKKKVPNILISNSSRYLKLFL